MEEEDRDEHEGKARRSEEKVISEEVDVEDKFNIVKVLNKSEGNDAWTAARRTLGQPRRSPRRRQSWGLWAGEAALAGGASRGGSVGRSRPGEAASSLLRGEGF